MAALLVGMSIMAVMMAAALPVWSHATRREKEAELIWRGEQYKRAIMLFQRKYANTFPPSVDVLVDQRFLRKKYKDPITDDEFQIIPVGGAVPGMPGMAGAPGAAGVQPGNAGLGSAGAAAGGGFGGGAPAAGGFGGSAPGGGGFGGAAGGFGGAGGGTVAGGFGQPSGGSSGFAQMTPGTQPSMGIQGVTSKSKDTSIKLYNGMNRYNQWAFVHLAAATQAGAGGATFASPGQGAGGAQQPGPFGAPGGTFGAPGGGFGQPMRPPVPGGPGGFGQPGQSPFGQPGQGGFGQPGGGFGTPTQPGAPAPPGGGIFTPSRPGAPGQPPPPPQF